MDISLVGAINSLSYGYVTLNVLEALVRNGHSVSLFPLNLEQSVLTENVKQACQKSQLFNPDAPSVRIWHQNSMDMFPGRGLRIGWPIFELNRFTDLELHHLKQCDKLIVCSEWAKQVLTDNEVKNKDDILVVPLGVDTEIFKPEPIHPGPTIFSVIGKWEKRKAHDVIIECFKRAFPTDDENVLLLMACTNNFLSEQGKNYWETLAALDPRIRLVPRLNSQKDVAKLINSSDCGIYISRAEGWNLPLLETLACGRHVIATNYSAHTEFLTSANANLINISSLVPAHDDIMPQWFHGQGEWADITDFDKRQIIYLMNMIFANKRQNKLELNHDGLKTAQQFTWDNTVTKLIEGLTRWTTTKE